MIKQLDAPCWIAQDGYPSGDGSHFATEAEAKNHAFAAPYRQGDAQCWIARCECGETIGYGGDDYDEIHYRTPLEAKNASEAVDDRCCLCEDEGMD